MFKLHDYQTRLVNEARQKLAEGNRGVLIQSPPGSGKSVVIAEVIKLTTDRGGHVLFIVHRKELIEQIERTLIKHEVNLSRVTIMTVTKAKNRLHKMQEPTLIVTDETHHSRASTYRAIYDHFSDAFRLGFTATPYRMNGKGFTDIYDTAVFGKSVDWLIENNNLAPFKYYSVNLSDEQKLKESSTGDYTKASIDDAIGTAIFGDVVSHYRKLANGRRTILYAHSVESSKQIAEVFKKEGIEAVHADATTNKLERERIMQDFRDGRIQVLCNVDLISEGFDVPDCSCVIQMRPTASLVLYMQQAMRSMRYQPNKQAIIIDHVGNYSRHGLPNAEHDWHQYFIGFDKRKKKKGKELSLFECPSCFGVIEGRPKVCPHCEQPIDIEVKSGLDEVDTELVEIDLNFKVDYTLLNYARKSKEDLETLDDFYLYAKAKNFKEAWIKFQLPEFKTASWPRFYKELNAVKKKYNY